MKLTSLQDLLLHTMQDVYYAEKHIHKALPDMIEKASDPALAEAFEAHRGETETQIERLEQAFASIGETPKGVKCHAIEGILKEATEIMDDCEDPNALDAGMIMAAQAVEHYEFTRYGTMASWARTLGHTELVSMFETSRDEEIAADVKLTKLAEGCLNRMAVS